MQAGKLRSRISIQRATKTQNSFGEDILAWETLGSYWAEILPLTGREMEALEQRWAEAQFKIRLRVDPSRTFRREDRIVWSARTLDILDVEDADQRKREIRIIAREITQ